MKTVDVSTLMDPREQSYRQLDKSTTNDDNDEPVDTERSDHSIYSEDMDIEALREAEKEYKDLLEDSWHMGIIAIVKDLPDIIDKTDEMTSVRRYAAAIRLFFCLANLAFNVVVQIVVLIWVQKYVVRPSVHNVQLHYKAFHGEVFNTQGQQIDAAWEAFSHQKSLCESSFASPLFLGVILLLWTIRMLQEFRETNHMRRHMDHTARLPEGCRQADMIYDTDDGGDTISAIIALSTVARVALWVFILFPKFAINFFLLFVGCRWLVSTENFADLIMNALALEFIIGIDEYMFAGLFPETATAFLGSVKFAPVKLEWYDSDDAKAKQVIKQYHRSILFVLICVAWVVVYLLFFQQVLPGFANDINADCSDYYGDKFGLICQPFEQNCFPYGTGVPKEELAGDADTAHVAGKGHHHKR